jgi:hypothetical protein
MHPAAYDWVAQHATASKTVLDIGGRDINGTVRELFPGSDYTSIDLAPGRGVDVVGDVCNWKSAHKFQTIVCLEVLEHAEHWQDILDAAGRLILAKGHLIVTAAGPGREPHSAVDGAAVREGEWYKNITRKDLTDALDGWRNVQVDVTGDDIRAVATR